MVIVLESVVRMKTHVGDHLVLVEDIQLVAKDENGLPNALHKRFENELALVGYEINNRQLQSGDVLAVTLFWQGLEDVAEINPRRSRPL